MRRRSSPENRVGAGAVVDGEFYFRTTARDFAMQRSDPGFEFDHGEAIEILAHECGQGIVGPGPKDIIQIHERIVDRCKCEVNKAGSNGRTGIWRVTGDR